MLRSILVVIAGLVLGMFVITAIESMIPMAYPLPPFDPNDPAALRAALGSMPTGVFVILVAGWAFGALAAGVLAARLALKFETGAPLRHALAVGIVQTAGVGVNFAMLPHPTWVLVVGLVVFVPMALLGGKVGAGGGGR
jgi:hypothetical protein